MTPLRFLTGLIYLLYGVIKIIIALSIITLPERVLVKIPIVNLFMAEIKDKTLAGKMYDYVLSIFGIYTIIHGLSILHITNDKIAHYLEQQHIQYAIYITLGTTLLVFYSLVLYTNIPISKQNTEEARIHYRFLGIGSGIYFILIPFLWEFLEYIVPKVNNLSMENKALTVIGITILIIIFNEYLYYLIPRDVHTIRNNLIKHYS